jgi:hypothetical protein
VRAKVVRRAGEQETSTERAIEHAVLEATIAFEDINRFHHMAHVPP